MSHRRFVGFAPPPSPPRTSSPTSLGLGTCHGQIDHFAHEDVESAVVWTRRLARTSEVRAVAKSVLCGFRTLLSMLIHVFPHFDPQTSFVSSCLLHSFRLTYSLQASSSFVILRSSQVTVVESSRERRGLESRRPGGWKPNVIQPFRLGHDASIRTKQESSSCLPNSSISSKYLTSNASLTRDEYLASVQKLSECL